MKPILETHSGLASLAYIESPVPLRPKMSRVAYNASYTKLSSIGISV